MGQGWISLHRCLTKKTIWTNSTPEQKTILITLLLMANHRAKQWEWMGEKFEAKEGQFITSIDKIKEASGKGISTQNVRTALKRFEKLQFLTNEPTKTGRLITVANWGLYQDSENTPNIVPNKDLTNTSQTANKQLTPNNNDNNDNNDNKKKSSNKFSDESLEIKLSNYLYKKMLNNDSKAKEPNLQTWAASMDKLMRSDNRTEKEIRAVIDYCQESQFWKCNILSTAKLREKFSQLKMQSEGEGNGKHRANSQPDYKDYGSYADIFEK